MPPPPPPPSTDSAAADASGASGAAVRQGDVSKSTGRKSSTISSLFNKLSLDDVGANLRRVKERMVDYKASVVHKHHAKNSKLMLVGDRCGGVP